MGDLQLTPGATKEVPAPDAACCRAALSAVVATSIIVVTLGALVGEWLGACPGSHTRRLAQRRSAVAQWSLRDNRRAKGRACKRGIEGWSSKPPQSSDMQARCGGRGALSSHLGGQLNTCKFQISH